MDSRGFYTYEEVLDFFIGKHFVKTQNDVCPYIVLKVIKNVDTRGNKIGLDKFTAIVDYNHRERAINLFDLAENYIPADDTYSQRVKEKTKRYRETYYQKHLSKMRVADACKIQTKGRSYTLLKGLDLNDIKTYEGLSISSIKRASAAGKIPENIKESVNLILNRKVREYRESIKQRSVYEYEKKSVKKDSRAKELEMIENFFKNNPNKRKEWGDTVLIDGYRL